MLKDRLLRKKRRKEGRKEEEKKKKKKEKNVSLGFVELVSFRGVKAPTCHGPAQRWEETASSTPSSFPAHRSHHCK